MLRLIYLIIINAVALFVAELALPGLSFQGGWITFVIAAAVITLLNLFVKPILKFLSFPLVFFTLGLFSIIINAVILFLTHYLIQVMDIEGVALMVDNILTYLLAAIIFGLANGVIHWFLKE